MSLGKTCVTPTCVGTVSDCMTEIANADGFGDTIEVIAAWDVVNGGTRVPPVGNLPIASLEGNALCTDSGGLCDPISGANCALPCRIGAPNSTLSDLPGHLLPGLVRFRQNQYLVPAQASFLIDQANVTVRDLCDNSPTGGCSSLQTTVQFTAFSPMDADCDKDGVHDSIDNCPGLANADQADADGDGIGDPCDNCPATWNPVQGDVDGNGDGDCCEPGQPDCNANGLPDLCDFSEQASADCNDNAIPDECDIASAASADCDGNNVPDECDLLSAADCQPNDIPDTCDIASGTSQDCTGNGIPDECESDCNGNLNADSCDIVSGGSRDCNRNAIPDECDIAAAASHDCNSNGVPDECDADCNRNRLADSCDLAAGTSQDCDASGVPDECEHDCNRNRAEDSCDIASGISQDCDLNDVPDECDVIDYPRNDCNRNNIPDPCDIASGTSQDCEPNGVPDECITGWDDCNGNSVPDTCDAAAGTSLDCQPNGYPDECELGWNDCNQNNIPDDCDTADGTSPDCQPDGYPDECELPWNDCNENKSPDNCDVANGTSSDCQSDGYPDECQLGNGYFGGSDCNANGVPDECDITGGFSNDCQPDGVPDECQLDGSVKTDCNANEIPDECEPDCNQNGVADDCDLAAGTSSDCSSNGYPDECEPDCNQNGSADSCDLLNGISQDCDSNGLPDECYLSQWWNDCNLNSIPDSCDLEEGTSLDCQPNGYPDECELPWNDCNQNNTPDDCDVRAGSSFDCQHDGVPDECQGYNDCNTNDVPDLCDIANGTSRDCLGNGIPDECELADGVLQDCNDNGLADLCDIYFGPSRDCNSNLVPDECDIAVLASADCNHDAIPDECESDCNANGVTDDCDVAAGTSQDCDTNGFPDECDPDCNHNGVPDGCDLIAGTSPDCQSDGIPDECQLANTMENIEPADSCRTAPLIEPGIFYTGSTVDATIDGLGCELLGVNEVDVWYRYRPSKGGTLSVSTCQSASFALFSVHTGCPGTPLNEIACPFHCFANLAVTAGMEYWIRVIGFPGDPGGLVLRLTGPDGVQSGGDCNDNAVPDACDISAGTSSDCTRNDIPDECEADCNGNARADSCDIDLAFSVDCNANGVPDECDIASATSGDCNANGVPDDCEWLVLLGGSRAARTVAGVSASERCQFPDRLSHNEAYFVPTEDADDPVRVADSFTFAEPTTLTSLRWWGLYRDVCGEPCESADDFTVSFFVNESGPASKLIRTYALGAAGGFPTGLTVPLGPGFGEYQYEAVLDPPLSLEAGKRYWLEIRNGTASECVWRWETAPQGAIGNGASMYDTAGDGFDEADLAPFDLAFCVSGIPAAQDCNRNGIADAEDMAGGASQDCQPNGIPDDCEDDRNFNGVADTCDIVQGASRDLNFNGVPDEADCPTAPGDMDGDCDVERDDFVLFQDCMGTTGADLLDGCVCADFTLDGTVTFDDFLAFSVAAGQPTLGCRVTPPDACPDSWTTGAAAGRIAGASNQSFYDFGIHGPIPAGFFGDGSDAFGELVNFIGTPADPNGVHGDIDTQIQHGPVVFDPDTGTATTPLDIVTLNLISREPITITYDGGQNAEQWLVVVGLSPHNPGSGQLTATLDSPDANAGTYDATVYVQPAFLFVRMQDLVDHLLPECVAVKLLDTGNPDGQFATASSRSDRTRKHEARATARFSAGDPVTAALPPITLSFTGQPFVRVADPAIIQLMHVSDCAQGNFVPGVIESESRGGSAGQQLTCTGHITEEETHYFCPPECQPPDVCRYSKGGNPTPFFCSNIPLFPEQMLGRDCIAGLCNPFDYLFKSCAGGGFAMRTYDNPTCVAAKPICTGACCTAQGRCVLGLAALCDGTYMGDTTTCGSVTCTPIGACCHGDGTCEELPEAQCNGTTDTYQGDGTTCSPDLCCNEIIHLVTANNPPGLILWVNHNDNDRDNVADFGDGYDLSSADAADNENRDEKDFLPLVFEVSSSVDLSQAKLRVTYNASDPAAATIIAAPPFIKPAPGSLRLWLKDGNEVRSPKLTPMGDYVASGMYDPSALGLSSANRILTLWLEGIRPSASIGDQQILVELDPDGPGPADFCGGEPVDVTLSSLEILRWDSASSSMTLADHVDIGHWGDERASNPITGYAELTGYTTGATGTVINGTANTFVDFDPDRFMVHLRHLPANANVAVAESVVAQIGSFLTAGTPNDHNHNITLRETSPNSGIFDSESQLLTAPDLSMVAAADQDDGLSVYSARAAALVVDEKDDDRTHKATINDIIRVTYSSPNTPIDQGMPVCQRVPTDERKDVRIHVHVFNEPFDDVGFDGRDHTRDQGEGNHVWDHLDVGADGLSGTGDVGEGDGMVTVGEPYEPYAEISGDASRNTVLGNLLAANARIAEDIDRLNTAWMQACIKFTMDGQVSFEDAPSINSTNILSDGTFDTVRTGGQDDYHVVLGTPGVIPGIAEVFYVAPMQGAFGLAQIPLVGTLVPPGHAEDTYLYIGSNTYLSRRTLAHEFGHALTNQEDTQSPQYVYFPHQGGAPGSPGTSDAQPDERRRLRPTTIMHARMCRQAGSLSATGNRLLSGCP